jgi:serine/threonine protein phosphatase PrpC
MDSDGERLEVGALSETGYTRAENQDRMTGARVPLGHLYIVADGMGGHKGGALAAQMAVEELQRHIGQASESEPADSVIEAAFKAANDAVYKRANSGDLAVEGMGTTAVLLLISGRIAKLAHVGDSRAYLYRNHTLSQLTTDHTIVQRMVEAGMLKPDEIADHPQSSVLERAIGSAPTVGVDISNHQLQEDDVLLLCSDGLSGYVTADQIEVVLRTDGPVQETT